MEEQFLSQGDFDESIDRELSHENRERRLKAIRSVMKLDKAIEELEIIKLWIRGKRKEGKYEDRSSNEALDRINKILKAMRVWLN